MFDTQSTARDVSLSTGIQSFSGTVSSTDGLDYYKLQVNSRSPVSMSLSGLGSDVNLFLLDNNSKQLAGSSNTGIRSESIKTTLDAGSYYIKVERAAVAIGSSSPYQLTLSNDPLFSNPNSSPQSLIVNGLKTTYAANSTLTIGTSYVSDGDGWANIDRVDFWLSDSANNRIELADAINFTSSNTTTAKFGYSTSLSGLSLAVGNYSLNAVAYDKAGATSGRFTSTAFAITNAAPQSLTISGVGSSYNLDVNPTLTLAPSFVTDSNGWQDVSRVDFWLTDAANKRVELADVTSFTANGITSAKFDYSTSLIGIAAGTYKLNAAAFDKTNAKSSTFVSNTFTLANSTPRNLTINGVQSSYNVNTKLTIDSATSNVSDLNGWNNISKVDFWLTDSRNNRIELADATSFTSNTATSAKFAYSTSLTGLAAGNYTFNALAYDKAGATSNLFAQSILLANNTPQSLTINGVQTSYDPNTNLTLAPSFVTDTNGWKDISKVDFWLTDSKSNRIELADVTSFTSSTATTAQFNYSASLLGLAAGNYNLNALSYDKAGLTSNLVKKSFAITNSAAQNLTINGVKSSYDLNSTLTIAPSSVVDNNGWQDASKIDFWLTDANNNRIELADVTSFTSNSLTAAGFNYSTSLNGIAAGNYSLNAIAYDKARAASNTFSQSLNLINTAPQSLTINGAKSLYEVNEILTLAPSFVSDINGWQDINKVDFWLTDALENRIELSDVTTFAATSTTTAQFAYSTALTGLGLVAGNYSLNALAYDKTGATSNRVKQAFTLSTTKDWFDINIKDINTMNLARTRAADGKLDRHDLISIFRDVQDGDVVDTSEFTDLKTLLANTTTFSIDEPFRYLSNKVTTESFANISATNFETSIGKWFLGTVAPTPTFTYEGSGTTTNFTYTRFQGSLYGNNTSARIGGIDQRSFGDCVLLAALGATFAPQSNDAGNSISKTINDMLIDNGDYTYTVRFFTQDLKAEWVTVDNRLATTDGKNLFGTSNKDGLWAPIIEKACAQWREFNEGSTFYGDKYASGWDIIGNGDYLDDGLQRITGRSAKNYYAGSIGWDYNFNLIQSSLTSGKAILAAGVPSTNTNNLVSSHAYTVTNAYINANGEQRIVVRNPWGIDYSWSATTDGVNDGFIDLSYNEFRQFGYITIA